MKKLLQQVRFIARVIADDISIISAMCFRKECDPEQA